MASRNVGLFSLDPHVVFNENIPRFSGVYFVIAIFTMKETRQSIILRRLAQKMRKQTGDSRYRAQVEETQPALRELVWISCTRPIRKCSNLENNTTSSRYLQRFCSPNP